MAKLEILSQAQRDDIHTAMIDAARKILAAHCGAAAADIADRDGYMIEHLWMAADDIAAAIDWQHRHECATDIMAALHLRYDDGHADDLASLLAQHWDDADYLMDRIRNHDFVRYILHFVKCVP